MVLSSRRGDLELTPSVKDNDPSICVCVCVGGIHVYEPCVYVWRLTLEVFLYLFPHYFILFHFIF